MHRPIVLLLLTGLLLAVNINLAKAAADAGISPLLTAFIATVGAGGVLLVVAILIGRAPVLRPRRLLFYAVAGGVSYALPNALVFVAADRVGAAYASILHALVPSLTYLFAIGWGLDRLSGRRAFGVLLGLIGAMVVVGARRGFSTPEETTWLLLGLIAPVSIAFGNVLRSRFWPQGAEPLDLAPGMLLFAGLQIGIVLTALSPTSIGAGWVGAGGLLALQVVVSSLFYALYFRLQHVAGPVYLSQIGYVGTAFGLPIAILAFGDRVTPQMLVGGVLVVGGVLLTRPVRTLTSIEAGTSQTPLSPMKGPAQ